MRGLCCDSLCAARRSDGPTHNKTAHPYTRVKHALTQPTNHPPPKPPSATYVDGIALPPEWEGMKMYRIDRDDEEENEGEAAAAGAGAPSVAPSPSPVAEGGGDAGGAEEGEGGAAWGEDFSWRVR